MEIQERLHRTGPEVRMVEPEVVRRIEALSRAGLGASGSAGSWTWRKTPCDVTCVWRVDRPAHASSPGASSSASVAGRPKEANTSGPKVTISATRPSSMRSMSTASACQSASPAPRTQQATAGCLLARVVTQRNRPKLSDPKPLSTHARTIASRPTQTSGLGRHAAGRVLADQRLELGEVRLLGRGDVAREEIALGSAGVDSAGHSGRRDGKCSRNVARALCRAPLTAATETSSNSAVSFADQPRRSRRMSVARC